MNIKKTIHRMLALLMTALILVGSPAGVVPARADGTLVMTLGADLSPEQKQTILDFFNVKESEAMVITVTNADERKLLLGQYTEAQIGTRTFSCALVNPTGSGGIQVKTANLNVVTSGRIASILSTSGVTNCEVLAAAPFMVSGTGALTGVMMGYEQALGITLDPELQRMAIEESTTVSQIGETIGQNEATLVVNDIKIRIVRDQAKDTPAIVNAVDTTVQEVEDQLALLAAATNRPAPQKLNQQDHETLYAYGEKLSAMNYDYDSMKVTLQRVTANAAREIGIDDPIMETFEDLSAEDALPENSILQATNDESMGEDANITATDNAALDDAPTLDAAVATASLHGSTYALFDLPMTWTDARRYCRALGGDLASIGTLEEQGAVQSLAAQSSRDYSWIGGQYYPEYDRWYWSDGSQFQFFNWDDSQPDGADRGESFLRMANRDIAYADWTAHAGKWNDAAESGDADIPVDFFGFICELKDERGASDFAPQASAGNETARLTGVRLERMGAIEGGVGFCPGTSAILLESNEGRSLADLQGNLLTDCAYRYITSATHGLIEATAVADRGGLRGVIAPNGRVVVPCEYDEVRILNNRWAVGFRLTEATEDDCDFRGWSDDKYYMISVADVYCAASGSAVLLASLSRAEYAQAVAKGDYVNIQDRSGSVTTYDSSFSAVARDVRDVYGFTHVLPEAFSGFYSDEAEHHYGIQDLNGDVVLPPFADSINEISDGFVLYSMRDGDDYVSGLITLEGENLLPAVYDSINGRSSYGAVDDAGDPLYCFNHFGYYMGLREGRYVYAVRGGEVTADTGVSKDQDDVIQEALALRIQNGEGQYTLIAADGQVTRLDRACERCWPVDYSSGLFWEINHDNSYNYDMLDWHGNTVLSDYERFSLSGDGGYLAAQKDYQSPLEIYAVICQYDDGREVLPEGYGGAAEPVGEEPADNAGQTPEAAEPSEEAGEAPAGDAPEAESAEEAVATADPEADAVEEASEADAPAGNATAADMVSVLEKTIATIQAADFEANRAQIAQILETEAGLLSQVNGDAAAILSGAVTLVQFGAGDADTVVLLLQSAMDKLR